jgi:hypothetical protein
MRDGKLGPLGGLSGYVEVDETFIGKKADVPKAQGFHHKHVVLTLVERKGRARSFHVDQSNAKSILPVVLKNIDRETNVMTDEATHYQPLSRVFQTHSTVNHQQGEYGRGIIHTNTIEGYYSIFKRGMKGIYQHCSEKHLHRYLAEYDFRYSHRVALGVNDEARGGKALSGIVGKRLTYRRTSEYSA